MKQINFDKPQKLKPQMPLIIQLGVAALIAFVIYSDVSSRHGDKFIDDSQSALESAKTITAMTAKNCGTDCTSLTVTTASGATHHIRLDATTPSATLPNGAPITQNVAKMSQ